MSLPQFLYHSLRAKLIVAFLTVALLPLGILSFLNEHAARRALINEANETLLRTAKQTATIIDAFMRANLDAVRTEAQLLPLVDYLTLPAEQRQHSTTAARASAILHSLSRKDPLHISSYALLDHQGRDVIDTFTADIGMDKSNRSYFRVPLSTGLPYVSPIQFSPMLPGRASLYFSSPIRDTHGETVGILATCYNAVILQQLITQTNGLGGKQSFAILLDENHVRLAHGTAPELLFTPAVRLHPDRVAALQATGRWPDHTPADRSTNLSTFEQGLAKVGSDAPYFTTRLIATGDVLDSAAVTPLGTQPWLVVFAQPQGVFLAHIQAQTWNTVLLAMVIVGIVATAAVLLAHRLAVPVIRLTKVAEKVAAGDLTVQASVRSNDEVGKLAATFNGMTLQLRHMIAGLEQRIVERERAEEALQQAHDVLESRVAERTAALQRANAQLLQSQKMEAIGTLAGGIAHEFNNILSAILGYTELTQYEVPRGSKAWSNLHTVLKAGSRAKDLVQQILTFSRQSNQERRPVSIPLLVKETLTLLRASLPTTIAVQQHIAEDADTVLADPTHIHQILINLCANAEYAMRNTGGLLTISVDRVEVDTPFAAQHPPLQPGSHLRLTVSDSGSGMTPAVVERIFEPFFTTKEVGEGNGMGLAIVHGIVTSYDGAITVESTPGEGSTFTIYLPRITDAAPGDTDYPEEALPQATGRILFVDDEDVLAHMGQDLLEHLGYEVVVSTNSMEALQAFQQEPHHFDLVITDQTMPYMTGAALARELRRIRSDIPIILCTGFSHVMNAEKAREMGIDAFCLKPLVGRDLAVAIQQVLGRRST